MRNADALDRTAMEFRYQRRVLEYAREDGNELAESTEAASRRSAPATTPATLAKLADASDLKSAALGRAGSIPARGTINIPQAIETPLNRFRKWLGMFLRACVISPRSKH